MLVRPATTEDASAIAAVDVTSWRAAYRDLMPADYLEACSEKEKARAWRADIEKHGARGRKRWFVAETEAGITGYALAGIPTRASSGMLYLLYTLPEAWGTGTGPALLRASMDAFRDLDVAEGRLWVLAENARARRFYEREGWTASGGRSSEDYGGVILDALEYMIQLST